MSIGSSSKSDQRMTADGPVWLGDVSIEAGENVSRMAKEDANGENYFARCPSVFHFSFATFGSPV